MRQAFVDGEWIVGDVTVDADAIDAVGVLPAGRSGSAVPGFLDLQVNGFGGVNFTTCDRQSFGAAAAALARHGVTTFLPTIPTAPPDQYPSALALVADAVGNPPPGARALGVHLEGPFLSDRRPGAHNPQWLRQPTIDAARQLVGAAPVVMMTLAPELPGALEVIDTLRRSGVVISAGHTDATAVEARAAFDAGVTMVTHLWNAQRQVTSREPGLAGVALARDDVFVGLIADLVHVSAETLTLSLAAAGPRAVVVTDASWAAGLPDGVHHLDGHDVVVGGGAVRLTDGTLTGASIGLDDCVRNLVAIGRSLEEAIHAVTTAPAAALGRPDLGRLTPGGRADVVVLDDEALITRVLVAGEAAT